ncbi:hypothetical protein BGX26_010944 [Mortierella sp. AD094]|nr:hypothetical protein BGX26_010944 [Mortierella sp. AD094]
MSDIQTLNNNHFNKTALDYDNIPKVHEMTQRASEVILEEYTTSTSEEHVKDSSVLDFGCGTGLCSFKVAPKVKKLLGVDAAEGMLNYLNHKLSTNAENAEIRDKVKTVNHLVTDDAPLPEPELSQYLSGSEGGFDMIYSTFTLHHIENVQGIINTLSNKMLNKNGWLIVLDFEGSGHRGHHHHGEGHGHGEGHHCGHGEGHHRGEGHAHAHHHHHHHGHQGDHAHHGEQASHDDNNHQHGESHKNKDVHDLFVDEHGKPLEHVPHKGGFTLEGLEQLFKNAGLVDVSAHRAYGMTIHQDIWSDVVVVKGRRA